MIIDKLQKGVYHTVYTYIRKGDTMASEAQRRAVRKYNEESTTQVKLKLNINTDADILRKLDSVKSKNGYIKELIRKDMRKG